MPQPSTRCQAFCEVFFSDCWDCSLIAEIAVWLLRLQSDCWDCKSSTTYIWCPNPAQGVRHVARCFTLIAEIAVWLLRLQKFGNLLIHVPALNKDSGMLRGVLLWLQRLQSDCWDCSLIAEIAVWLLRLQKFRNLHMVPQPCTRTQACWEVFFSDCWDCSLITEIVVWLLRLQSGISGMTEISERKANALNFLNPVLSTNQRPQFWALNQWEASISGPPILTHFQNQTANSAIKYHLSNHTAISAIRTQSPQSECNLSNQTAILLHCSLIVEIAVG